MQRGDTSNEEVKPKRTTLPPVLTPEEVTLQQALFLLSLPKTLGQHPELRKEVKVGIGRFGPYVVCDGDFRSIPKSQNLFEVNLDFAMGLLSQPKRGRGQAAPLKELGPHPELKEEMKLLTGRYGPYIKMGKINISLPEDMEVEEVTPQVAVELLASKLPKSKKKTTRQNSPRKKVSRKKGPQKEARSSSPGTQTQVKPPPKKKTVLRRRAAI